MIIWRLRVVMAERDIKNKDLAKAMGVDDRVVSRWRSSSYVPKRLNVDILNRLCKELRCQPGDLLRFNL